MTPSTLTVSVIEVLYSSMLKGSMRQFHAFVVNIWLWQGESYTCCNLLPVYINYSRLISDLLPTRLKIAVGVAI